MLRPAPPCAAAGAKPARPTALPAPCAALFEAGLAKPNALDLELEVDEGSRLVLRLAEDGRMSAWAIVPLSKGRFWEIVAVPDIREQVAAVAEHMAEEVKK